MLKLEWDNLFTTRKYASVLGVMGIAYTAGVLEAYMLSKGKFRGRSIFMLSYA
jgi:hypothetical protein